jgi:L-lysine 2,3-aminomutase
VVEDLINWDDIPEDPIYQLTFPQAGMLERRDFDRMYTLVRKGASESRILSAAREIQLRMNPHPAGQMELNVPHINGQALPGVQHKYRETVLFFPSQGQTCHAYCTYCFRWAQFVGIDELKFANREAQSLVEYLKSHREVHSILFTGGDPLIMKTRVLRRYIEPLLSPELDHLVSIRIELDTPAAQVALRRIHSTGAVVRCQAPVIRNVNDNARAWAAMWRIQVQLGAVPYYMFVERDTGPKNYFEVPLARAYEIFRKAYRRVSGLGRTVRGPSMSATPGKVVVEGITRIHWPRGRLRPQVRPGARSGLGWTTLLREV